MAADHPIPFPTDNTCRFEDEKICGFMQDKMDNFDWTRQNALTQNPKRTVNTGPPTDISGTPEGKYTSGVLSALAVEVRCTPLLVRSPTALGAGGALICFPRNTLLLCTGCREQAVNLHVTDWH